MNPNFITKRLSRDTSYQKPKTTFQESLSQDEIKEKLKDYKRVESVKEILIGSHVRYFTKTPDSKKPVFRLGGVLTKFGEDYKYVVLSNGKLSWSVQVPTSIFYVKKSLKEMNESSPNNEETEKLKDKLDEMKKLLKEQYNQNQKLKQKLDTVKETAIKEVLKKQKK
jgi:hypothetical protein